MENTDIHHRRAEQATALHAAIGKFVVEFEQMCFTMKTAVLIALQANGLKDQQLTNAVLAGLTAAPLREITLSVFSHLYRQDPGSLAIVRELATRTQELIQRRNQIIHSTWFVGWGSETDTDFSQATGVKIVNTSTGPAARSVSHSVDEFEIETEKAKELTVLYGQLYGCLLQEIPLFRYFNRDSQGATRPGPNRH